MKLKHLLLGALPLALLASCSNDNVPENREPNIETKGGYLAFNIQLPTQRSTRAANDNYDDGTTNEYTVDNAAIVIFKGANEKDATVEGAYVLYDLQPSTPDADDDNITTQYTKAAKINAITTDTGDKLFALAILNYSDPVIKIENGELSINGSKFDGDFKTLVETTTTGSLYNGESKNSDKFFMTNAPLSKVKGSETRGTLANPAPKVGDTFTLVEFDKDKIKDTESEAKADPAASIYVERAVAKATLESVPSKATIGEKEIDIKFWGWYVDNTEKSSYIVRNLGIGGTDGLADYLGYTTGGDYSAYQNHRFVGSVAMGQIPTGTENDPYYRIYWCKDPNYNTPMASGQYDTKFKDGLTDANKDLFKNSDYIFYPYENTFSVANQNYHHTTRAVFRMTIGVDKDGNAKTFYTLNGDEKTLYETATAATSVIWAYLTDATAPADPGEGAVAGHNSDIREAFKKALNPGKSFSYGKDNIKLVFITDKEGAYKVQDIQLVVPEGSIGEGQTFASDPNNSFTSKASLISYINATWRVLEYKDGNSYYEVRFKHFADEISNGTYGENDLAPWKWAITEPTSTLDKTSEAYGTYATAEQYYLGRYGMVRNNWYSISIGTVKRLGSPVPPNVDNVDKSDDNKDVEKFISFKINVLSWAKRTQKVDF